MQPSLLDTMKARYRFHEWPRAREGAEQLFVKNYRVLGDELPNPLIKSRVARLGPSLSSQPAKGMASLAPPSPFVRLNTSTWKSMTAAGGRPLLVDVFEYPSSELAQESLLGLTTQFHLPVDLEVNTDDVGDVCIATPDGAWFGFTRGNVLVRVMSGSGTEEPARVVAQLIDTDLIAKPPAAAIPVAAEPFHGGQAVPFSMAAMAKASDEAEEDKPFIKIFSKGGTVTLDHDSTIVPESPEMEIEVFVRQPGGQWIKGLHQPPTTANVEPNVGSRE